MPESSTFRHFKKGYALHFRTAGCENGYALHVHTAGGERGDTLHVHTASGGKGYVLHVHTAGCGNVQYTPCTLILLAVEMHVLESETPCMSHSC